MQADIAENLKNAKPKDAAESYIEGIGRRKNAVARVRIYEAKDARMVVNGQDVTEYFATPTQRTTARQPVDVAETDTTFYVSILVHGGGPSAQAEAVRHGLARALVSHDPDLRPTLKKAGFLKRDPREVERKKFGLRKARKKEQWSKR